MWHTLPYTNTKLLQNWNMIDISSSGLPTASIRRQCVRAFARTTAASCQGENSGAPQNLGATVVFQVQWQQTRVSTKMVLSEWLGSGIVIWTEQQPTVWKKKARPNSTQIAASPLGAVAQIATFGNVLVLVVKNPKRRSLGGVPMDPPATWVVYYTTHIFGCVRWYYPAVS